MFGNDKTKGEVYFNNTRVTEIIGWVTNLIKVKVPAISEDGNIYVFVNGNKSNTSPYTLVRPVLERVTWYNYGYESYAGKGFGNETIYTAGDQLELAGKNFGNTRGPDSKVFVGGIEATTYTLWEETNSNHDGFIRFIIPEGARSGLIEVSNGKAMSNGIQCTIKNIWSDYLNNTNYINWETDWLSCQVQDGSGAISEIGFGLKSPGQTVVHAFQGKVIHAIYVQTLSVREKYTYKIDGNISDNGRMITSLKIEESYEKEETTKEITTKYASFQNLNIPITSHGFFPSGVGGVGFGNYYTGKNVIVTDYKYTYTNSSFPLKNLTSVSNTGAIPLIIIYLGKK